MDFLGSCEERCTGTAYEYPGAEGETEREDVADGIDREYGRQRE